MTVFPFRVILSSWGIAIDITAELRSVDLPPSGASEVHPGVFLSVDPQVNLTPSELERIKSGLRRVGARLAALDPDRCTLVELSHVWFAPADYQLEGFEAAIIAWASEVGGFDPPVTEVRFDDAENRYVFTYE